MPGSLSYTRRLKHYVLSFLLMLSAPGVLAAAQLVGETAPKLSGEGLVNALKKGGYVIYFRHGETSNIGDKDVADTDLGNCALQRNLSAGGQSQTKAIGQAFKALQIPVSHVYSSPYCRCLDTAKNIFGKVQKSSALHFAVQLDNVQRDKATGQLLELLGTQPPAGTNVALISHTANLQEAVGIWPKPEGVAHIFKPEKDGQFSYVGMMLPEAWTHVAAAIVDSASTSSDKGWFTTVKQWFSGLF